MSTNELNIGVDLIKAWRWNQRRLVASPWLHEQVAKRMQENLAWIKLQPQCCIYWMPNVAGIVTIKSILQQYHKAQNYFIEPNANLLKHSKQVFNRANKISWLKNILSGRNRWQLPQQLLTTEVTNIPTMLWANMLLHAQANPKQLLSQWLKLLQPNGFLMFSCFGPNSFVELKQLYQQNAWDMPTHEFLDMHDWGDYLNNLGYTDVVMDMEQLTLQFASAKELLSELRQLGFNLSMSQQKGAYSRKWYQILLQQLNTKLYNEQTKKIQLSVEIIYGHAVALAPTVKLQATNSIDLATMRKMLHQKS